ncbi:hypothetical protein HEP81_08213 (plasmid) [Streptomyces griseofuscus]|uniref:Uncharacterized protein n=1 Tax=Streptomyces griseofuscus TaxID=146922 RepID=A0A7H1QDQ9_9ACTN|nr:hypothetical protein [Streptomyces griseofuscus]QNT98439.1 hypothetical protein HEP81_08213 [Streptomyces griseofuscus]
MQHIEWRRAAITTSMTTDAYRELCWGAHLPEVAGGYGLLLGYDVVSGELVTAVIEDVEYVRLLIQSPGATVPREKITKTLTDWPTLDPDAESVWS